MQVVGGATSSISVTSCARIFVFVAFIDGLLLLLCCLFLFLPWCSFSWWFFWLVSCLIFLLWKPAGCNNLSVLVSVFFRAVVRFFAFYLLITIHIIPCASSCPPSFLLIILSGHHDHPCTHSDFCRCVHTSQNIPCSPIWGSFCLIFSSFGIITV